MSLWGKNRLLVGNTYSSSNTRIANLSSTTGLYVGMPVSGNNVPAGTFVRNIVNSTAVNTTAIATGAGNGTYTFWEPPKYTVLAGQGSNAQGNALFENTTPGAFVNNQADGVFPVNAAAMASHHEYNQAGWVLVREGTGPVLSIAASNGGTPWGNLAVGLLSGGQVNTTFIVTTNSTGGITSLALGANGGGQSFSANSLVVTKPSNSIFTANISGGGSGYTNGDIAIFANAAGGAVNATFTVGTNTTGGITSLTLTSGGRGFDDTAGHQDVSITNSTGGTTSGSSATLVTNSTSFKAGSTDTVFTVTLGGRANRTHREVLATVHSMKGTSPTLP